MTLTEAISYYAAMKTRLLEVFDDIDDQTLADTMEGCTDFREVVAAMAEQAERDALMADLLKQRIKDLTARKSRYEAREETVRREIQRGMEETGVRKIELPECTLSLRSVPPSVIIIDESLLPDDFCTIVRKPDRKSIKAALEDGEVPGAMMSNGGTALSVRKA
jgi:hypothetical protein